MWFETDTFPAPGSWVRSRALTRLRVAMAEERRRRRIWRRRRRLVVAVAAIVLTIGIAPPGLDGEVQPLLGLADALATSPSSQQPAARHWYTRSVTRELVSVPVVIADGMPIQFLVESVEETWHDAGDVPRRTKTFGDTVFLSSEDEDAFYASGLALRYRPGRTVELPVSGEFYIARQLEDATAEELGSVLRRRVAGLGDRRMEEVHLLRLTADIIGLHADDVAVRAKVLRVIADIPGIRVLPYGRSVVVAIDYVDGDRPLRLMYEFDADTAHLVGEYLAALATQSEPATVLRSARHAFPTPVGFSES